MFEDGSLPQLNVRTMKDIMSDEEQYHDKIRNARRFICIKPTAQQEILNLENSSLPPEAPLDNFNGVLSIADRTVWGKNFKLRVRSRDTGRSIDFNFRFTHENDN